MDGNQIWDSEVKKNPALPDKVSRGVVELYVGSIAKKHLCFNPGRTAGECYC
jgi:hypothetical protein